MNEIFINRENSCLTRPQMFRTSTLHTSNVSDTSVADCGCTTSLGSAARTSSIHRCLVVN